MKPRHLSSDVPGIGVGTEEFRKSLTKALGEGTQTVQASAVAGKLFPCQPQRPSHPAPSPPVAGVTAKFQAAKGSLQVQRGAGIFPAITAHCCLHIGLNAAAPYTVGHSLV